MAVTAASLKVVVGADTKDAESGLKRVGGLVSGFGKTAAVAGTALVAGLAVGFGTSINAAASFEQTLSGVQAVSNATAGEMAQLRTQALALGQDVTLTGIGAQDAARAMEELSKGGVSVADQLGGATRGALLLASAGGLDVARAAEIAADSMNIFGLSGGDVVKVADLFAAAANSSSLEVNDLAMSMAQGGQVAAQLGFSIQDTTAAFAAFGAAGLKGSDAGTSLKTALLNLTNPTDKARAVMEQYGLSFFDANGKMLDFQGIAGQLQTHLKGLTDQQRLAALETIFGADAVRVASILYNEGADGIAKWNEQVGQSGAAAAMGAKRNDNLRGSIEQLKSSWETAQIALGTAFLPLLRQLVDQATAVVNAAIPLINVLGPRLVAGIQGGARAVVEFAGAFGALATAFKTGDFNRAFGPFITAISDAFGSATAGKVTLFVSQLLRDFQLLRDAIITAGQAFSGKWLDSDAIAAPVRQIGIAFSALGAVVRPVVEAIRNPLAALATAFSAISEKVPVLQGPLTALFTFVAQNAGTIGPIVAGFVALGPALTILGAVLPAVVGAFTGLGSIIGILSSTLPILGAIVGALGGPLTIALVAVGALALAWATNFGGIRDSTAGALAAIQPPLQQFGAFIAGTIVPALQQLGLFVAGTVVPALVGFAGVLSGGVAAALTVVGALMAQLGAVFAAEGPMLAALWAQIQVAVAPLVPLFGALAQIVGATLVVAVGLLVAALGGLVGFFAGSLPGAIQMVAGLVQAFGGVIAAVEAVVTGMVNVVSALLAGNWAGAWQAAEQAANQFSAATLAIFEGFGTAVVGMFQGLVGGVLGLIGGFVAALGGYFGGVYTAITGQTSDFAARVVDYFGRMATGAAASAQDMVTEIGALFDGLGTYVRASLDNFIPGMIGDFDRARDQAGAAMSGLASAVRGAMDSVVSAVTSGVGNAVAEVGSLRDRAIGALGDLSGALFGAGVALIQGFVSGVLSMAGAARDAVSGVLAGIGDLFPHSEPKDPSSPLRGLVDAGAAALQMFADGFKGQAPDAVKAVMEALSSVAGALKAGVEGLTALGNFKPGKGGLDAAGFAGMLQPYIDSIVAMSADFESEVLKAAGTFADTAGKVAGLLRAGVEGLSALATFTAPGAAAIADFKATVEQIVRAVADTAMAMGEDAYTAAGRFAESAAKVVSLASGALGLFKDLAAAGQFAHIPEAMRALDDAVFAALPFIERIGFNLATVAQNLAPKWSDDTGKVISLVKSISDLFVALAKDAGNFVHIPATMKLLDDAFYASLGYMREMAFNAAAWELAANQYQVNVSMGVSEIKLAMARLAELPSSFPSLPGLPDVSPSLPGHSVPTAPPATGGGHTSTTVVNINAPTYGVNQVEDVVVSAVVSAQRRGRL